MDVDIWDLGSKINIKIKREFMELINFEIKRRYGSKPKFYKVFIEHSDVDFDVFRNRFKYAHKSFLDLHFMMNICLMLDVPFHDLQNNIVAYKISGGYNTIENPILPIKITPILDMLVAHTIGDGNVAKGRGNREPYLSYRQYDQHYKLLYIKKIESVFGRLNYRKECYKDETNTQVSFPAVISALIFKTYNLGLDDFKTETARIPKEIFDKDWKHKLAFLIGIIIDEGFIDSCLIVIRMKNFDFIKDLEVICNSLGYETTIRPDTHGLTGLYILSRSLDKFYKHYLILLNEHPEADLGYKGKKLKEFIDRIDKPKIYLPGNKIKVLELLSVENLSVNELATKLSMTRQGARYLVHKLVAEDKIEVKSIAKFDNWKYGVKSIC
jgi:hypothetical protein